MMDGKKLCIHALSIRERAQNRTCNGFGVNGRFDVYPPKMGRFSETANSRPHPTHPVSEENNRHDDIGHFRAVPMVMQLHNSTSVVHVTLAAMQDDEREFDNTA